MEESRKGKSPGGAWDDQALTWQEVETEHLAEDQWIDFRRVKYRMPDGSEAAPFYNYSRKDYVVIAARDTAVLSASVSSATGSGPVPPSSRREASKGRKAMTMHFLQKAQ